MPKLQKLLAFILLAPLAAFAQTTGKPGSAAKASGSDTDVVLKRNALRFDLQALDNDARKLDKPLAQARAKTAVAVAAWALDKEWAKRLLREAYELTFPDEQERNRLRQEAVGARSRPPTEVEWARTELRNRIFAVAGRDKTFAAELSASGAQALGRMEEVERQRGLALQALRAGELAVAGQYASLSIKAEPTQGAVFELIPGIATRDRALADRLLLEYIEQLRSTPLTMANGSALRVHFFLFNLIAARVGNNEQQIQPPGPAVLKAYGNYVIESMTQLSQREPESLIRLRPFLLAAWPALRQSAPELTSAFMELERLGRRPGEEVNLPAANDAEARKARMAEQLQQALKSGRADEATIGLAVGQKDFASARKLIDLLADEEQKPRLADWVNAEESLSLAMKEDDTGAETLAQTLTGSETVQRVYQALIGKCVKRKDASCVMLLAARAEKQLRRAATGPALALSLSTLANAVAPSNEGLAFELLDEAVAAANATDLEASALGRLAIEPEVFATLAVKDETRTWQSAQGLKSPAVRIVVLAAILQRRVAALAQEPASRPES
ncbi:MAG TPA: hypothetical protein VF546_18230 [Pyrinomonadaceae bacterium]